MTAEEKIKLLELTNNLAVWKTAMDFAMHNTFWQFRDIGCSSLSSAQILLREIQKEFKDAECDLIYYLQDLVAPIEENHESMVEKR